ncbi:SRPBCC family protein [Kitasatospora purpeofusca]|uniref:hypothetical protein n=1 Tax=Kitasatospora purpeofusca TaxID=67352 RepID=UPI00380A1C2D
MSGLFETSVEVDRPVEELFAFLADGRHDPEFSPRVRVFNTLEGHGLGKVLAGPALRAARKDAPDFGRRTKAAIEGS